MRSWRSRRFGRRGWLHLGDARAEEAGAFRALSVGTTLARVRMDLGETVNGLVELAPE